MRYLIALLLVCMINITHATIYLDELVGNSLTGQTSGFSNTAASVPVIISTGPATPTRTNPLAQLSEIERDAEFMMALRWIYDE